MALDSANQLKRLQTKKSKLELELKDIRRDQEELSYRYKELNKKLTHVKRLVGQMHQSKEPIVSEHALLRYLERVRGINLDTVRQEILTDGVRKAIEVLGSGTIPLDSQSKLLVRNGTVVTVTVKGAVL